MIKHINDIKEYLLTKYTIRKLYNRTGGKEMYYLREFFIEEFKNNKIDVDVDNMLILDILTSADSFFSNIDELFYNTLSKITDQNDLIIILKNIIRLNSFYNINSDFSDKIWDLLDYDSKYKMSKDIHICHLWHNQNKEDILYYLYQKSFINFTKKTNNKYHINRQHDISNLSVDFLKKVKVKFTNSVIEDYIKTTNKHIQSRINYLFTIPELREKFIDNEKWMFMQVSTFKKFIDYYPEEERQKYIEVLKNRLRKERMELKCVEN